MAKPMSSAWCTRSVVFGAVVAALLAVQTGPPPRTEAAPPSAPVTGHPRLWVRAEDLPRLRSWAVPGNLIYQHGLARLAQEFRDAMDAGTVPNADLGGNGYELYATEMCAELFAFMSLISPDPATRENYAQRARTLLMHVMNIAVQGAAAGQPFRDPEFASAASNRSRWYGEGFALTVDWIYDKLSAADKATIRTVFLRWANEYYAKAPELDSYPFAPPRGVFNNPLLVQSPDRRWAGNNYFTAHMRNLGLMAMALDPADDTGNALRDFLRDATGSWMYMFDHLVRNDSLGGLLPEGFEYSPQTGAYVAQFLLALYTAGQDDPAMWGPQVRFAANPYWDQAVAGYLHSISPRPVVQNKDDGPVYVPAWYGDGQVYNVADSIAMFGALGVYDHATGNQSRLNHLRWIETHTAPGGAERLSPAPDKGLGAGRAAGLDPSYATSAIMYFMLFDPAAPPAPDPRGSYPTAFFAPGLGRILARTGWDANATWFTYMLKWNQIDHQLGDGNMFELYRRGEWLTKERTGYDGNAGLGCDAGSSEYHNTLALQNDPPEHNEPGHRNARWFRGSQWQYGGGGDPRMVARSFGSDFIYGTGDATNLYNSTGEGSTDILHASRSIVWLKPDHVVVYDRAASRTANRFKRFWLNLPTQPTLLGNRATVATTTGQQLFVTNLLPADAAISSDAGDVAANAESARDEPMAFRLRVEAPGGPASTRFLNVLQGADPGASADAVTLIQSTGVAAQGGGTPFAGALVKNIAVLFPVDLGVPFTSVTYSIPSSTMTQLITGLTPNVGYAVASQPVGGNLRFVIGPGAGCQADSGGVLRIPCAATIGWRDVSLQQPATGGALLNWAGGDAQASYLVVRWSPRDGIAILPRTLTPLAGNSYTDTEPLVEPTYCYLAMAVAGAPPQITNVLGFSDLLCLSPGGATGNAPLDLRVQLNQGNVATLNWSAPGGQTGYDLVVHTFGGNPPQIVPLGNVTSTTHDTGGQSTCFELRAKNGATTVGTASRACAVPNLYAVASAVGRGGSIAPAPLGREVRNR